MANIFLKDVEITSNDSQKDWYAILKHELADFPHKIIVLDDDPTGTQTVHDVLVYTDWSVKNLREGFAEKGNIFYILTNSRSMSEKETEKLHQEIAINILKAASHAPFLIVSRSDSTLRGHYPLETDTLKNTIEARSEVVFDGELICPFFAEGNRLTVNDTHYIKHVDRLLPVGESEFAKDRMFGYSSSNLKDWVNEKSHQREATMKIDSLELADIRAGNSEKLVSILCGAKDFSKIIVNALDNNDLIIVSIAIIRAIKLGKKFIFRTAATLPRALSGMKVAPLLTGQELIDKSNVNGGLIIVGSHVKKSTVQLEELQTLQDVTSIEMNTDLVLDYDLLVKEGQRVLEKTEKKLAEGQDVVVYTKRKRFDLGEGKAEAELKLSVQISNVVTSIVKELRIRPSFIIAKGGITSSEIATEGLGIKKGYVLGQVKAGIPVWLTDEQSKFPNMPYIIFPGNVGTETDLKEIVSMLKKARS